MHEDKLLKFLYEVTVCVCVVCVCGAYNCVVECLVRIEQTTELCQKLCLVRVRKVNEGLLKCGLL